MVAQSVALDARDRVTWRAQQEHAFLSDGVDDVANFLVVQQERAGPLNPLTPCSIHGLP